MQNLWTLLLLLWISGCEYVGPATNPGIPISDESTTALAAPQPSLSSVEGNADGYQGGEQTASLVCSNQLSPTLTVLIHHEQSPDPTKEQFLATIWVIENATYRSVPAFRVTQKQDGSGQTYETSGFRLIVSEPASLSGTIDGNLVEQTVFCLAK